MRPARLKLAAYNLQNLGREDNPNGVYERKLEYLTGVIRELDADLVAVAEVREEAAFTELVRALGSYPESLLSDLTADRRQLQVGLLTRLPVVERGQWHDFPAVLPGSDGLASLPFRRSVPWLRVRLADGSTLQAAAVHLKSGRPEVERVPESELPRRREVLGLALATAGRVYEAAGLRCRLDEAMARGDADHYAVLGDFNDGPESEGVRVVRGAIATVREGGGSDAELLAITDSIPEEKRVSYVGWGQRALLDHILVSRGLHARLEAAGIETGLLEGLPRYSAGRTNGYPRSDHAPVWAVFDLSELRGGDA
ncbi:MAG TPA: hypothetical protein ENN51_04255 [candidate division WOR-3 bacterium]|uniref:Endonuclease/exonuclease/phosphatase domain-containing protein n=1 Tax=candidate division WOR-3 bacterium TaxID=2052148 RepID=A0A7V0T5C8_UNCW3|nr:hypothetical protein [candidate division WOR-3 bacterium]